MVFHNNGHVELTYYVGRRVSFKKCDVSQWDDVLDTFQAAHEKFGTIHAVLANAGINKEDFLKDQIDEKSGRLQAPDLNTIHVNLVGAIYIAKCTAHYAAKWPESRTHLVMTGSAASYIDTPPLHLYCASKAGILGLMRGLRTQLISKNITVNMVAPWFTCKCLVLCSRLVSLTPSSDAHATPMDYRHMGQPPCK